MRARPVFNGGIFFITITVTIAITVAIAALKGVAYIERPLFEQFFFSSSFSSPSFVIRLMFLF